MSSPHKTILENWSALIAIAGSSYLALLDKLSLELSAWAEMLQWPFVIVGVVGTGSVLFTSWQASKRPGWRAARGLGARRPRAVTRPRLTDLAV